MDRRVSGENNTDDMKKDRKFNRAAESIFRCGAPVKRDRAAGRYTTVVLLVLACAQCFDQRRKHSLPIRDHTDFGDAKDVRFRVPIDCEDARVQTDSCQML